MDIFEPKPVMTFFEQRKIDFENRYTEKQRAIIAACPRHRTCTPDMCMMLCATPNSHGDYGLFAPQCDENTCPIGRQEKQLREEKILKWKIYAWLCEHVLNAACASVEDVRYHWMVRASKETVEFRDNIRDYLVQMTDDDIRKIQFYY